MMIKLLISVFILGMLLKANEAQDITDACEVAIEECCALIPTPDDENPDHATAKACIDGAKDTCDLYRHEFGAAIMSVCGVRLPKRGGGRGGRGPGGGRRPGGGQEGDRPEGDRPEGDRPEGDKPEGGRPGGGRLGRRGK